MAEDIRNEDSQLVELKNQTAKFGNEIRKILNKPNNGNVSEDDKKQLKSYYVKLANLSKSIAKITTDATEKAKYEDMASRASAKAAAYGSSIRGTVPTTTFEDVKGLENVKNLVKSFVYMAQNKSVLDYYHIKGGLGVLMYGAPGTGKTLFAEAVAHELNLPLFTVTPADIFKPHVGESEASVKELFDEIDSCIDGAVLFVDECESIFSARSSDTADYKSAVTTELLQRINGMGVDGSKRIMIAATNRPWDIDSAYLRYKRFSNLIHITPPDDIAKEAIIRSKLKGIALDGITIEEVVQMSNDHVKSNFDDKPTGYYSGADLSGICEEACRQAIEIIQAQGSTQPIPLKREMFEKAFKKIQPSISRKVLEEYIDFRKEE